MVRFAAGISILSVVIITVTLFLPFPLGSEFEWKLPSNLNWDELSKRAGVGSAIATAFALMLAAIAVLIAVRVESSDYRAEQDIKADLAILLATLSSILTRKAVATSSSDAQLDFTMEFEKLAQFVNSTTGFAFHALISQKSRQAGANDLEWRLFFLYFAEIGNENGNGNGNIEKIINRCIRLQELILSLKIEDMKLLRKYSSRLDLGISNFEDSVSGNVILDAMRSNSVDQKPAFADMLIFLKAKGIEDPNIEMFLAVLAGDSEIDALNRAIDNGADLTITDTQLIEQYKEELEGFF